MFLSPVNRCSVRLDYTVASTEINLFRRALLLIHLKVPAALVIQEPGAFSPVSPPPSQLD
ncbi:hypothetical protein BRE01_20050 [Brevibacillus reuszeri]|uniref:Uncharacterized protein n=1 Tax=Brevibacillus reuszeri TaxID=54915 RepID=A0ABQ0TK58_9BACL|nr:hypothetical protein BRE01_20050 [Brevibacillus reuszeri]